MQVIFFVSERCKHSTVCRFFASERGQITTQFSVMNPNLASIMQFADVSFALLQKMCDDKFSCNELSCILPCSAQVLAAKCCNCTEHFCANTAGRQTTKILRTHTQMFLHRDACTRFHRDASHKDSFRKKLLHIQVLLPRNAFSARLTFTRRCF